MKFRYLLAPLAGVIAFASVAHASSNVPEWDQLDYERMVADSGMIYIPLKNLNRGPVWYEEYDQVTTTPTKFREYKRVFVALKPMAHLDGSYNQFVHAHHVNDTRSIWIDDLSSVCEISAEMQALVASSPYPPSVQGPSYPDLCTVSIIFPGDLETEVMDLIRQKRAVLVNTVVPLCSFRSPSYSSEAIVAALVDQGVLTATARQNEFEGRLTTLIVRVNALLETGPLAVAAADVQEVLDSFFISFVSSDYHATVRIDPSLDPSYVCDPDPLQITFGVE